MTKQTEDFDLDRVFYGSDEGWKFCSSRADTLSEKFRGIVLDELGNHPIGNYELIDDCACMLSAAPSETCGCECHRTIEKLKQTILSNMVTKEEAQRMVREAREDELNRAIKHHHKIGSYHEQRLRMIEIDQRQALRRISKTNQ